MLLERIICVLIGYVFGLFQTGYIYGRMNRIDIREHGSGNSGTTNALRTLGWKAGVITFVGDCLKCIAAIGLTWLLFGKGQEIAPLLAIYTGAGAVLGHNYPAFLKFKGGKGIATTGGLVLALNPILFVILFAIFVLAVLVTKYVSLGSMLVSVLFFVGTIVLGQNGAFGMTTVHLYEMYAVAAFLMILALIRHRQNILRLCKGTENKFGKTKEN